MPASGWNIPRRAGAAVALVTATCLGLAGCSTAVPWDPDQDLYQRAERLRMERLEREVERLRADLRQAEEAMIGSASGQRANRSRAVSALAEARIAVERASESAPWREAALAEARSKLQEAERQVRAGHFGPGVFFATRAQRIAEDLGAEARAVSQEKQARFVHSPQANLRAGPSTDDEILEVLAAETPVFPERSEAGWMLVRTPSGRVGWIHVTLLSVR